MPSLDCWFVFEADQSIGIANEATAVTGALSFSFHTRFLPKIMKVLAVCVLIVKNGGAPWANSAFAMDLPEFALSYLE